VHKKLKFQNIGYSIICLAIYKSILPMHLGIYLVHSCYWNTFLWNKLTTKEAYQIGIRIPWLLGAKVTLTFNLYGPLDQSYTSYCTAWLCFFWNCFWNNTETCMLQYHLLPQARFSLRTPHTIIQTISDHYRRLILTTTTSLNEMIVDYYGCKSDHHNHFKFPDHNTQVNWGCWLLI
jgi:hypothetical protein